MRAIVITNLKVLETDTNLSIFLSYNQIIILWKILGIDPMLNFIYFIILSFFKYYYL